MTLKNIEIINHISPRTDQTSLRLNGLVDGTVVTEYGAIITTSRPNHVTIPTVTSVTSVKDSPVSRGTVVRVENAGITELTDLGSIRYIGFAANGPIELAIRIEVGDQKILHKIRGENVSKLTE
ncbi:hypothetical protein A2574_01100 [Candidatus Shapirobacteria bacterium RIFOXYD1_FULL_38_32]|uniref:Uncharacterized protein n=3 Tax=Candidatus Shapironibacteriota TaxID=1752721 RepID=A0A0G0M8X0_9BACT|nr:MAG: hypothetical protein US90_C0009G0021 [Candidatus Shapirobacteria bacterium GW2011_GWE2_38_30]KKQ91396.1 MAG: hypothetical protein UT14_C0013G0005 [Candidatus Shapirobacteria bacterium GW2011_GWE1_38_92]OGL57086.1 MAG: hypothetical protein A2410_03345 [Candidatus Shapirobacteria bacterium RIFOXYC1_FULL_38_24]OGL57441.1 MAG: hypothetical protein A2367_00100 [Candidatus Shapirobacteria bacterium RIFOXYB1_FULL_38_38]OGL58342.1 MAG: hypothetical protein A2574_01100 [Candidatus Shapirobacteri